MKVLVTGGTGFIGSHLVEALLNRGVLVRCLIRRAGDLKWLKGFDIEVAYGDCCQEDSLRDAVRGVDQVFHLAGVTKAVNEETFFEVNASGTEKLIHACIENNPGLKKFIYVSSQAAAGPCLKGTEKRESDPCEPVSPYGQSKRMAEELVSAHSHELPLLILRPCAVYGPRDRDVYALFKCLSRRIKPCLAGKDQHLSLCYVQDVVAAILLAAESEGSSGEVFFVSDGHAYRMEEIGDALAETMKVTALRIPLPGGLICGFASFSEYLSKFSGRPSLISKGKAAEMVQTNWVCDITKARTVLGFEPNVSFKEGARLTADWYRKENWL